MIVEEIMKKNVETLFPENTIADAIKLMADRKIRHIPIVNSVKSLIGLVSDRDIKDAAPSIFHWDEHRGELEKPIKSIMTTNVITGHPLDFVEEISGIFYDHNISCLPNIQD